MSDTTNDDQAYGDADGAVPEPTGMVAGRMDGELGPDEAVARVCDDGLARDRVHVLHGEDGVEVLRDAAPDGLQQVTAWLSDADEIRQGYLDALRDGDLVVTVRGVDEDDRDAVASSLADAGATEVHVFGDWAVR